MSRVCTVCVHEQRPAIDRALVRGQAVRSVAHSYGLSPSAVDRHFDAHLPAELLRAQDVAELAAADTLLSEVRNLQTRTYRLLERAEENGHLLAQARAIREARGNLELLGKLMGQLDERPQVNILVAPEWLTVRAALLTALGPYPEARAAVALRLRELEPV